MPQRVEMPREVVEKKDHPERSERHEKSDKKLEKGEYADRAEKSDRAEKGEKAEKHSKSEKSEKSKKTSGATPTAGGTPSKPAATPPVAAAATTSATPTAGGTPSKPAATPPVAAAATTSASSTAGAKAAVAAAAATKPAAAGRTSAAPPVAGLSDEAMTQVAQAKFEAQEERLRDVARYTSCLLRDYTKLQAADCNKRIAEIRKALMRYELQYLRVCELQERRRRAEIANLQAEAKRCREEAEAEGTRVLELHAVLDRERKKRKRYERYEDLAAEVNRKKSRDTLQADIDRTKQDIEGFRKQRSEVDARIEERSRRAQLLRHAAEELAQDLRNERAAGGVEVAQVAKDEPISDGLDVGRVLAEATGGVEVIS